MFVIALDVSDRLKLADKAKTEPLAQKVIEELITFNGDEYESRDVVALKLDAKCLERYLSVMYGIYITEA